MGNRMERRDDSAIPPDKRGKEGILRRRDHDECLGAGCLAGERTCVELLWDVDSLGNVDDRGLRAGGWR